MAKTLAQLRTDVRRYINEDTANQWTDAELNSYINDAQDSLMGEIVRVNPDYMLTRATTPTVASQEDYATPLDLFGNKFRNLCVYESGGYRSDVEMASVDKIQSLLNSTGRPRYYAMIKDSFIVVPVPDSTSYTLELWYTVAPTTMSGDADTTIFNDEETGIITLMAAIRALDRYGMPGTERLKDALKGDISQLLLNVQGDDQIFVESTPLDMT